MIYQAWWWTNPPEERDPDLATAEKTLAPERDTLDEAKQDVIGEDPPHTAFIDAYEIDRCGHHEVKGEYDDPRSGA